MSASRAQLRFAADVQRLRPIASPFGDVHIPEPKLVTVADLSEPADLILLSCKSYDLMGAVRSFEAAVGRETLIIPLLNGMAHLAALELRFGAQAVLGGTCFISAERAADGTIRHLNDTHRLTFGARTEAQTARVGAITAQLSSAGFETTCSKNILQDMWSKWVFIASSAGMTCLMRSSIGDYVAAGAGPLALKLVEECAAVARAAGFDPGPTELEKIRAYVTMSGSPITTSMLRDIERDMPIEADQIIGDMLARADGSVRPMLLDVIHSHLKAYIARHGREVA